MPATTAHGYPYPLGTDRVMDGDDAIKALAEKIEARLAGGTFSWLFTLSNIPANTVQYLAFTFPAGMFGAPPQTVATSDSGNPQWFSVSAAGPTAAGVTLCVFNHTAGPLTVNVHMIAHLVS